MTKSARLFERARLTIPGGVNSPVRACRSVGCDPLFIARGRGAYVYDADGNEYIDYVGSWGPLILGHAHPVVMGALAQAMEAGLSFGAPTSAETMLAELITGCLPAVEMVRLVNSGTEAAMTAVRLARAVTGRPYVIKFDGCYHGHSDSLLVAAGSGVATLGIPGSPGVPEAIASLTLSLPYNALEPVRQAFNAFKGQVAAIIVEPVAANMGLIPPEPGFLEGLRELTRKEGALLIYDEVITGFRLGLGGAQGLFGQDPDLTCLGKIIGGGLPVGALAGKAAFMRRLAPEGDVYQAGTLSGNPLAVAAGLATLGALRDDPGIYERINTLGHYLAEGLKGAAREAGLNVSGAQLASLSCLFFSPGPVKSYQDALAADTGLFGRFYQAMRARGVYLAPSQFETAFVSAAHTHEDIDFTIAQAREVFAELAA